LSFAIRRAATPARIASYEIERDGRHCVAHLRLEPDGTGQLLIDASDAIYLNSTAALLARLALEQTPPAKAVHEICRTFRIDRKTAERDYGEILATIENLTGPAPGCPVHDFTFDTLPPFSARLSAPYRMDLAITYRCNNDCGHCYNARPRTHPEMTTEEWRQAIQHLWEVGVPHICFTGGEATLRSDLPELIQASAELGQIVGLLTNGRRLLDPDYVEKLVRAGLDHVQITLESHLPTIHDRIVAAPGAWKQTVEGIRNALQGGLHVMTNTTLLRWNRPSIEATIQFLADLGVPTVGFNAMIYAGRGTAAGTGLPEADLPDLLELIRDRTDRRGQRLIWYTPTKYCHFDPVQMELGVKGCTAALYNMCIESDGSVIPCQSYYSTVGHILRDAWPSIWNHDLCVRIRDRLYAPSACRDCAVFSVCGGGCPLALSHDEPVGLDAQAALVNP
jgi:radical SAM protein with 4Fe4S-binding SPASM domain